MYWSECSYVFLYSPIAGIVFSINKQTGLTGFDLTITLRNDRIKALIFNLTGRAVAAFLRQAGLGGIQKQRVIVCEHTVYKLGAAPGMPVETNMRKVGK